MWFYLSFADESGFLGGVILQADNFFSAVVGASGRGINPGGEVLGCELAGMSILDKPQSLNRLLCKEEVLDYFADKGGAKRLGDLPTRSA